MSMGDNFYKGFIRIMVKNKVEFLIVGAYAVNVHGYQRNTGDLDIWTNPTYENWDKLVQSIEEFGYDTSNLSIERLINNQVLDLKEAGFKIEILQKISGVSSFDEAFSKSKKVKFEGILCNFIGYNDLIKNKKAADRDKDKLDVKMLEEIKKLESKKKK